MTRHNWVGKVIHREMCQKFKFDYTNKWYMHNPKSVLQNEMDKVLWDFEIQTDHLISVRWPDLVIVKKICRRVDFVFEKPGEQESDADIYCDWYTRHGHQMINTGTEEIRGRVETIQTTALLRSTRIQRVLETQDPVGNNQLTLVWKTLKYAK